MIWYWGLGLDGKVVKDGKKGRFVKVRSLETKQWMGINGMWKDEGIHLWEGILWWKDIEWPRVLDTVYGKGGLKN